MQPAVTAAWVGAKGHTADAGEVDTGLAPDGSGVRYYIDSVNGNDTWTGLSGAYTSGVTGPWKTLLRVNQKTVVGYWDTVAANNNTEPANHAPWTAASDGSVFLFARGGTYQGAIAMHATSPTTVNKLTFGAYGTGARPIIQAVILSEAVADRAYSGTGNGTLSSVVCNQYPATLVGSEKWTLTATSATNFTVAGSLSGAKAAATAGVAYDNGSIAFTITAGGTPFVAGDKFTVDVYHWPYSGNSALYSNGHEFTLRNLDIWGNYTAQITAAGGAESSTIYDHLKSITGVWIYGVGDSDGTRNSYLYNCEVRDFGGDGAAGNNIRVVQNCYVHHNKLNNKFLTGSGVGVGNYLPSVLGCTISYNGYSTVLSHGIYTGGNGLLIQGNLIHHNKNLGWVCHGVHDGMTAADNDIYLNGNGIHMAWGGYGTYENLSNILIERNNLYDNGTNGQGFPFACDTVTGVVFRNNVCWGNGQGLSVGGAGDSGGGLLVAPCTNVYIYNNTIHQTNNTESLTLGNNDARTANVNVNSNIFLGAATSGPFARIQGTAPQAEYHLDGNIYYAPGLSAALMFSWFGTYYSLAGMNGLGREALGKVQDPLFTNSATQDYTLQSGSPAKNIALPLGTLKDYIGATRSVTTPSSGAYE
jgi:hypothetical protein